MHVSLIRMCKKRHICSPFADIVADVFTDGSRIVTDNQTWINVICRRID